MNAARSAPPRTSPGWALALTSVAFFMAALDTLVVITALPAIHRDLGAGMSTLEWTVNAYALASAAGIITAAAVGDRLGRRRVFTAGLLLFSLASAACALAPTAGLLIAARVAQGAGAAIIMPLSLTILAGAFPVERRGTVVGLYAGIAGVAVAGGPLVGGAVTQGLDWHWIFWINVPIGLVAAALAVLRLGESYGPPARLDLPGLGLVAAGTAGLIWGLVRGNEAGWGSAEVIAALGLGVLLLAGFAAWERRAPAPMLPLRLFRNRTFAAAGTTGFLMTASLLSAAFLVTQYFQLALGASPLGAGLRLLPWTATPLVVAPLAGALSDRIGQRPFMVLGMLMQAAGFAWLALVATLGASYEQLILPLIVAGVGVSMPLTTTPAAALSAVAPPDMGKASGTTSTLQRFGGAFGIAITGAVFAAYGHLGTPATFVAGLRPALVVSAALSLAGAVIALAVTRRLPAAAVAAETEAAAEAPVAAVVRG
jgi:EmrB/QacA subfamily drug resistance transporter